MGVLSTATAALLFAAVFLQAAESLGSSPSKLSPRPTPRCPTGQTKCVGRCCPAPPPGARFRCQRDAKGRGICDFTCPLGKARCGSKCYPLPDRAIPVCKAGRFSYNCEATAKRACGGRCCFSPPGSLTVCLKSQGKTTGCDWTCPAGQLPCAGGCWKIPANAVNPQCSTRGELIYDCDATSKKGCGGRCCFSPPGTVMNCLTDASGAPTGCGDWGCKKGEFKCAYFCKKVPAGCEPWCSVEAEMKCNCKMGYKRTSDWSSCVKV